MRAIAILLLVLAASPALAADGKALFDDECAACHPLGPSSGPYGPSLKGVIWRKIASLPDFAYTGALKAQPGSWSPSRLDAFLKDTQVFARGSGMYFAIQDRAERRAIVNYLKTEK